MTDPDTQPPGAPPLPKRNYQFEKRQLDLEKKRKKEEKRLRRLERAKNPGEEDSPEDADPDDAAAAE